MGWYVFGDILLLTDGKSKSFWLTKLRMYSIRHWFSGHANWTGGVRVLIAVTMVCRKETQRKTIRQHDRLRPHLSKLLLNHQQHTYLDSLFNIILNVLDFLLLLSETENVQWEAVNRRNIANVFRTGKKVHAYKNCLTEMKCSKHVKRVLLLSAGDLLYIEKVNILKILDINV